MATLQEIYNLKHSTILRNRLAAALAKAAEIVRTENAVTANHAARFEWAIGLLLDHNKPETEAQRSMWLLLQNATVQSAGEAATDNDLDFVAQSVLVNFLAGIDVAE